MLPLPVTRTSWTARRRSTSATSSPRRRVEFAQASTRSSEREATSFSIAVSFLEKSSVRGGKSRANSCHVVRPRRLTPVSSTGPRRNLSPATTSGPYRNAQPPCGVPPEPSGSSTTPSSVMNCATMILPISVSFVGITRRGDEWVGIAGTMLRM